MKLRLYFTAITAIFCLSVCFAQKQHGKASFYSKRATGARTASGQKIHHDSLTCAHRYYPFGTHLKVTNLSNDKSVVVKVIDRGPFGRGRIIDLSWAAAKEIDMISQGVASVKVELIENPIPFRPEDYKLPTVDFEVAETDYFLTPKWQQKEGKEKIAKIQTPQKKAEKKAAKEKEKEKEKEQHNRGKNH